MILILQGLALVVFVVMMSVMGAILQGFLSKKYPEWIAGIYSLLTCITIGCYFLHTLRG